MDQKRTYPLYECAITGYLGLAVSASLALGQGFLESALGLRCLNPIEVVLYGLLVKYRIVPLTTYDVENFICVKRQRLYLYFRNNLKPRELPGTFQWIFIALAMKSLNSGQLCIPCAPMESRGPSKAAAVSHTFLILHE